MGLRGFAGIMGEGAVVVDVRGVFDAGVVEWMGF